MFDKSYKKKIIIITVAAILIMAITTTIAIVVGLNVMLGSALYASPEIKQKKADDFAAQASSTPKGQVVFAGDSIIELYNLDKHFKGKGYINRGISGDRSDGLLARLQTNVIDIAPSTLFVMIGINDMGYDVSLGDYINNYNAILDKTIAALPDTKIYVFNLFPLKYDASLTSVIGVHSRTHELVKKWNTIITEIANSRFVETINLYDALSDQNGRLHQKYTREGLHISEAGYTKISSMLTPYLNK